MACLPFHLSAFVVGPHPTLYAAGYSVAQSFTALSNTDMETADDLARIAPRAGAKADVHARMAKKAKSLDIMID